MKIFLVFVCCAVGFSYAQITSRVNVEGKISAPIGDDVEGVVVYNHSIKNGTITDANGRFNMSIGINDRVEVVAMQYQKFVVLINKGVINTKKLHIFLNESVYLLDEVVVTPNDSSGNVSVDLTKINISNKGLMDVVTLTSSVINDTDYDWSTDRLSSVTNTAYPTDRFVHELNFVNIFKEIFQNNNSSGKEKSITDLDIEVRKLYNDQFFQTNLALEKDQINDFIFFAENNGLTTTYLEEDKGLDLIQFLVSQSKIYKNRQ